MVNNGNRCQKVDNGEKTKEIDSLQEQIVLSSTDHADNICRGQQVSPAQLGTA